MNFTHEDRSEILQQFTNAIFFDELKRLHNEMSEIIDIHESRYGQRAFLLEGTPIFNGDKAAGLVRNKKPIDPDLQPKASDIHKAQKKLQMDVQRFLNFWGTFSKDCETYQDFRDVLPDVVVKRLKVDQIKRLPRTREPGYMFLSSPPRHKRFEQGLLNIYHYLATELLF